MKRYIIFLILLFFSISFIAEPTRKIVSQHFIVYCPNNYPGERLTDYFEKAYHYYNTYFGFNLTRIKVYVKDIGKYLGLAGSRSISINRMACSPAVCAHELFHLVQSFYGIDVFGEDWVVEGTAVASEEIVYPSSNRYIKYANQYLRNPNKDLFNRSYDACLVWIYVWREIGVDKIKNVLKCYSKMENFTGIINGFGGLENFNKIFLDFAEANYFKKYDDAKYLVDVPVTRIFVSNSSYSFSLYRYGVIYILLNSSTPYRVWIRGKNVFGRILANVSIGFKESLDNVFYRNILIILSAMDKTEATIGIESYRGIKIELEKTILSNQTFTAGKLVLKNVFNISYPIKIEFRNLYSRNDTLTYNIVLKPLKEKVLKYNILVENKTIVISIYCGNILIKKLTQNIIKFSMKRQQKKNVETDTNETVTNKSKDSKEINVNRNFNLNIPTTYLIIFSIILITILYFYSREKYR